MLIQEVCALLKQELLENGYEYGFFLDGITHKPDMTKGFDKEFFERLLTEYRIQDPKDTMKAKVGTCNDVVVLMKSILDDLSIRAFGVYKIPGVSRIIARSWNYHC